MLRGGGTLKLLDEMSLAVYSRGQSSRGSPDTQAPGNTNDKEGIVTEEDLARNSNSAILIIISSDHGARNTRQL